MKKTTPSFLIVLAAILSLAMFTSVKGQKKMNDETNSNPVVIVETSMGNISIELDAENAPNSTANFLAYVEDGYFTDTTFHRVIPGFMIQGGGFEPGMSQKSTSEPIQNEADNGLKNDIGTIAMARTSDPHSATAQFFINTSNNEFLNHKSKNAQGWGYCVFGKVVEGLDVIEKIEAVSTHTVGHAVV